ncbi:MAG: hypothetical protein FJY10_02470 [Bacteroidetes bacterium]|nr:hypothetical protein [Bacteroidota bacterium]
MKKSILLLIILSVFLKGWSQPCLPEGIGFNYQSQIDSFQINHPNCTKVLGDVAIIGEDIENLQGLSSIVEVEGFMAIATCYLLGSLDGLENLKYVKSLDIQWNSQLKNLEGLENLKSIKWDMHIISNFSLNEIDGLDSLGYVGGDLQIAQNPVLSSIIGMRSLRNIGGGIGIWENPVLSDLSGLIGLQTINGELYISDNDALTSLHGLDSISAPSIHVLKIKDNSHLSDCAIRSICNLLDIPFMNTDISNNAPGCNSEEEVDSACVSLSINSNEISTHISIYPNPADNMINVILPESGMWENLSADLNGIHYSNINTEGSFIEIDDIMGKKWKEVAFIKGQREISLDVSYLPTGLYLVRLLVKGSTYATGKVMVVR